MTVIDAARPEASKLLIVGSRLPN